MSEQKDVRTTLRALAAIVWWQSADPFSQETHLSFCLNCFLLQFECHYVCFSTIEVIFCLFKFYSILGQSALSIGGIRPSVGNSCQIFQLWQLKKTYGMNFFLQLIQFSSDDSAPSPSRSSFLLSLTQNLPRFSPSFYLSHSLCLVLPISYNKTHQVLSH